MNIIALGAPAIAGIVIAAVAAVVIIFAIWLIASYNSLVTERNATDIAAADMDVYLKKRYDLIPNIVETVKGYASHESEVLTNVTNARANAQSAKTTNEKIAADVEVTRALRSINLVAENYPALKADSNFMSLQHTLSALETEIAQSRRYYNARAGAYNVKILRFPTNIVAGIFRFKSKPLYTVEDSAEKENVKVQF